MIIFYIAVGGFLGAVLRFVISKNLNRKYAYGTFLVNIIGSFLLGYFFYNGISTTSYAFIGTGFCGAFTTFSTFIVESVQYYKSKKKFFSLAYMLITYIAGIVIAWMGFLFAN
jgi:fluoride exporter